MSTPDLGWRPVDPPHPQPADPAPHPDTDPPAPSAIEALTAVLLRRGHPDA